MPDHAEAPTVPATLPTITVAGEPASILTRLEAAAKRGKLAGFRAISSTSPDGLFVIQDFGGPFESTLTARAVPQAGSTELAFSRRMQPRLAWVYLVVLIITVWPGVWLTDSMLRTYFTGYDYQTWMWYLPLTAPFVPWAMWVSIRKSRRTGDAEAVRIIGEVATLLGAAASAPTHSTPSSPVAAA